MIIDRLTSHGDRITYQPHLVAGRAIPPDVARAKEAAASLFGVHAWELLEASVGTRLLTWRARGKRAPAITLTRTTSVLQVQGSLHVPAGESSLSAVLVMASLTPMARIAAVVLMGHPDRIVHGDGIGWVWTVDLANA